MNEGWLQEDSRSGDVKCMIMSAWYKLNARAIKSGDPTPMEYG